MPPVKGHYNFEPTSGTWAFVKDVINEKLVVARAELEDMDTPPERTTALRERIATLKAIVALEEPEQEIPDGPGYG